MIHYFIYLQEYIKDLLSDNLSFNLMEKSTILKILNSVLIVLFLSDEAFIFSALSTT